MSGDHLSLYAFDPGKVTGWCHLSINDGEVGALSYGEMDHIGVGNLLRDSHVLKAAVSKEEIETVFVAESFVMNSKISQQPFSLETIGLIRYFAAIYQVPLHFQTPSQVKSLIKDEVIKRADLWVPSKGGHQLDAVRHSLYYLIVKRGLLRQFLSK